MKERFFKIAREVSKLSKHRCKIGAVICNHKSIYTGYNYTNKTHPKYANPSKNYCRGVHAEINAIIHSNLDDLSDAEIYVYRENKRGEISMSRPCENCLAILKKLGVKKMYYTTNEYPYFVEEKI